LLSIVIPVYNEKNLIYEVLKKIYKVNFNENFEVIVVDDKSTDGTSNILKRIIESREFDNLKVKFKSKNQGKGAALSDGFKIAKGEIIIIQDADFEYNPEELPLLLKPLLENKADVVYGSRFLNKEKNKFGSLSYLANRFLTTFFNFLYGSRFTDIETCYKLFKKHKFGNLKFISKRFEFEIEFTAKVVKRNLKVVEIPISYSGRTYEEGKKINWKDGIKALYYIIYFKFSK